MEYQNAMKDKYHNSSVQYTVPVNKNYPTNSSILTYWCILYATKHTYLPTLQLSLFIM